MKLGELKINVLKALENPQGNELVISNISELEDDVTYGEYLKVFIPSLNRALMRITTAKAVSYKTYEIDQNTPYLKKTGNYSRYDITALINDCYAVESVETEDEYGKLELCDFTINSNFLTLPYVSNGTFIITYSVRLPILEEGTSNDYNLDDLRLSNEVLNIIPYFIKGDIYEAYNPQLATYSRNVFESYLNEYENQQLIARQTSVKRSW